jgi:hypothetical protein
MAELKVKPVFKCKRCGAPFTANMRTTGPDPTGEKLEMILQIVALNGLCKECDAQKAWYFSQGRSEEWMNQVR